MAFRFSLQSLLRYRESFERRERLRLQIVTSEVVRARQQCEQAQQDRGRALEELAKRLRQVMTGAELHFELACDRTRVRRLAALKEHLLKLEDLQRRQLDALRKAQQQRKILENLRDRQLAAYRLVQNRRTQQQLDERFLILRGGQAG
jgi:flagellar export protein FliJ